MLDNSGSHPLPALRSLIFELAPGGELFEPIADTKFWFDEQMASRVMRQSLEGLRYLHERNIVHRDLKPENILLVSKDYANSTLKVIDFGLATQYDPADPPLRKHVGTPYYIAPEVLHKQYRESADVWSMGVIMFTIMCAYPPFWGNTEADIYSRIRKGMYRFQGAEWQRRSDDAKDMVRSLLQLDPAKRLNVHTALQHPWIVYEGEPHLPPTSPRIISLLRTWTSFPWLKRLHILLVAARWVRKAETVPRENQLWAGLTGSKDAKEITLGSLHDALQRIALQHPPSAVSISPPVMGSEVTGRAVQGQEQGDDRQNLSTWPEGDPPHCAWPRPPSSELGRLMAKLDTGACGAVSKAEFMAWACPRTQYLDSKNIIHSFKQLDVDGDGLISADDLVAVAHRLPTFTGITPHRPYSLEHYVYHIVQEASLLPPAISLQGMPMPDWQEGVPADMDAEVTARRLGGERADDTPRGGGSPPAPPSSVHATPPAQRSAQDPMPAAPSSAQGSRVAPHPRGKAAHGSPPGDGVSHPTGAAGSRSDSGRRPPPSSSSHEPPTAAPEKARSMVSKGSWAGTGKLAVHPAPAAQARAPAVGGWTMQDAGGDSKSDEAHDATSDSSDGFRVGGGGLKGGAREEDTTPSTPPPLVWEGPRVASPTRLPGTIQLPTDQRGMPAIPMGTFLRIVTGGEQLAY